MAAFAIDQRHRTAFRPEDRVLDIYHARNIPEITVDDVFELETLAHSLRKQYGVSLQDHWRLDMTLAELFDLTRARL